METGDAADLTRRVDELPQTVRSGLEARLGAPIRRVINATGIFLHTNLGRAPLPRRVAARLPGLVDAYCDLELDLGRPLTSSADLRPGVEIMKLYEV